MEPQEPKRIEVYMEMVQTWNGYHVGALRSYATMEEFEDDCLKEMIKGKVFLFIHVLLYQYDLKTVIGEYQWRAKRGWEDIS